MIQGFIKHIDESLKYLGQISFRLQKDQKYSSQVSLEELDCKNYEQADHHIHLALEFLKKQKVQIQEYQIREQENLEVQKK